MNRDVNAEISQLTESWNDSPRWQGVRRDYSAEDVVNLRSSIMGDFPFARHGAETLWRLLHAEEHVAALGCLTGAQAVNMVKGGLKAIYLSGWQVAADANQAGQTYPDMSLYPVDSVPAVVKRINNALQRADQINSIEGKNGTDWYLPIVADAEAGFGGVLHSFELMKAMIEAGAAGVHFEDQLAAEKKCGHMGGKVLVPTETFCRSLIAARLAADVLGIPTLLVARTDALNATLLTSDYDERDKPFLTGERTAEGYYITKGGMDQAISRGLAYAAYADLVWCETATPNLEEAERFANAIHEKYPDKLLAYNCSPSFNWRKNLSDDQIASFQSDLARMGYKFQFITLAGWHSINYHMFDLAKSFNENGMPAYVNLQEREFSRESDGYTATRHQREVGTGYFDQVLTTVTGGEASTAALKGSTEAAQFKK